MRAAPFLRGQQSLKGSEFVACLLARPAVLATKVPLTHQAATTGVASVMSGFVAAWCWHGDLRSRSWGGHRPRGLIGDQRR